MGIRDGKKKLGESLCISFCNTYAGEEDHIYIEGLDVNHIKNVLRMKVGEALKVSDGNNRKYLCEIESMTAQQVCVRIVEEQQVDTELPSKIYLFSGTSEKR